MDKYKDKAITIVQTLMNATCAEFEDENMAIDIIAGNLKIEEENYADLHNVTTRNWFEKLPLRWKLAYHMSGGIIIGYLLHYVW